MDQINTNTTTTHRHKTNMLDSKVCSSSVSADTNRLLCCPDTRLADLRDPAYWLPAVFKNSERKGDFTERTRHSPVLQLCCASYRADVIICPFGDYPVRKSPFIRPISSQLVTSVPDVTGKRVWNIYTMFLFTCAFYYATEVLFGSKLADIIS